MTPDPDLRAFVERAVATDASDGRPSLGDVEGQERGARDVALASLCLGDLAEARRWAGLASRGYLEYGRFAAEHKLDPDDPPATLQAVPWKYALFAIELATLAGESGTRRDAAGDVLEWSGRPFLDACANRETAHVVDTVACLAAFLREEPHEPHLATLRTHLEAKPSLSTHDRRYRNVAVAVEGVATADADQVTAACAALDDAHRDLDSYTTEVLGAVDLDATFCVALARERGLDVRYTSEFVPGSVVEHYPLE